MHTNSLEAWYNAVEPTLTKRELEVIKRLGKLGPSTCEDVAIDMGVYPNQISGRFTRLKKKGTILEHGMRLIRNRQHAIYKLNTSI